MVDTVKEPKPKVLKHNLHLSLRPWQIKDLEEAAEALDLSADELAVKFIEQGLERAKG